MSRIGSQPVAIPADVKVSVVGAKVAVEGPKGKLEREFRPEVGITLDSDSNQVKVEAKGDGRIARSLHGLTRALVQNMVVGVKDGFEKKLEIVGVGYLAAVQGDELQMRVGYANEIKKAIPQGLTVTCPDQNHVVVQGCDKQLVGQFAAEVRAVRKPEPYKGKGVRYVGEQVKIKPGKSAT
jgi:large subunit ribosomal protein L6